MNRRQRETREAVRVAALLRVLEGDPDRVISKADLAFELGNISARMVDRYASRLRRRLGDGRVVNCWGVGYRLNPEARE